jgi:malate dehydrogenase
VHEVTSQEVRVAVTGAAGQISYSLLFRLASGEVFGPDVAVSLQLIEIEPAMKALEGVAMELDDCAFPLLRSLELTSDLSKGFNGVNWALLIGSVPRKAGMERSDLLSVNGGIFKPQGQAIAAHADSDVRVVVVGNPCNTNAMIARSHAPEIAPERFFAMMRLDQNRAMTQLARKASVGVGSVSNVAIWGNHSSTQFPDFFHAKIDGHEVTEVISDSDWLKGEFLSTVQKRGAAIIDARGASSAASAANGVVDTVQSIITPTTPGDWVSLAVVSHGEYDVPEGLQFGFPVVSDGTTWSVVEGLEHTAWAHEKIAASIAELESERDDVANLLRD